MGRDTGVRLTATRRSQRFQPTATPSTSSHGHDVILECAWLGVPIYIRKTNPDLDCLPEELEKQEEHSNNEEDEDGLETVFYDGFKLKRKATTFRGSKGMHMSKEGAQIHQIGSTVMMETDSLDLRKRPPSIGVIVSMWQVRKKGEEVAENPEKMRIRIHWFLRPSEIVAMKAKRQHEMNEIYYCVSSRAIVAPSVVLSKCTISGNFNDVKKESKPNQKKNYEYSNDPDNKFYCKLAVDSHRAVFHEFNWEQHRFGSLQKSKPLINGAGLNLTNGDPLTWGECSTWDVIEKAAKGTQGEKGKKKSDISLTVVSKSKANDSEKYEGEAIDKSKIGKEKYINMDTDDDLVSKGEKNNAQDDDDDGIFDEPRTLSRKRGRAHDQIPRKRSKTFVQSTLYSADVPAQTRQRKGTESATTSCTTLREADTFAIGFPKQSLTFRASMAHLPKDPWIRAMHALHVGSSPDYLPCREEEYLRILELIAYLLEERDCGCIYISGATGTGKTATARSVVKELERKAEFGEMDPFTFVKINGLKLSEPEAAYSLLWEGISANYGHRRHLSADESLLLLMHHFRKGNPNIGEGNLCVVLMDELDQLLVGQQDVLYNFFKWSKVLGSKLLIIAVGNSIDLPESAIADRPRVQLCVTRIHFQSYLRDQLVKIVEGRLNSAKESLEEDKRASNDIIVPDAITLAAVLVGRFAGDARRMLDICRRSVEYVMDTKGTVKPALILEVVQFMQNIPPAARLRDLSFDARMLLTSIVKMTMQEGVELIKWGNVEHQHHIYMESLALGDDPRRNHPSPAELPLILHSLVASRAILVHAGPTEAHIHSAERLISLNIDQGEVAKILAEICGIRCKNVLGN